jgi:GT2 family glycosyltransferase
LPLPVRPSVTIVFLVHNRRDELRTSLNKMLAESDYDREAIDVVVIDNASEDGATEMVRAEFPDVRVVRREVNCGVSGFNDGFALAKGDFVLALDDDCYLPPDGLRRAVEAAQERDADLVSFGVASSIVPDHRFDLEYETGLLSFWGCAVLMRRRVIEALGGYDPEIFVWANETEFMVRFFDRGFRHLHMPEIVAVHMKPPGDGLKYVTSWMYTMNSRHLAYIAGKLLRPRHAAGAIVALTLLNVRDAVRINRQAITKGLPSTWRGFANGLRHRSAVREPVSSVYRHDFHTFANPFAIARPLPELAAALPGELVRQLRGQPRPPEDVGRYADYREQRRRYYPAGTSTLEL